MLHVEHRFPASFYAPARWGTADGCMPFRVCWAYFRAIDMARAVEAMDTAAGIGIAFAGENGKAAVERTIDAAFPRSP